MTTTQGHTVYLPRDLWRQLKILAAQRELTLARVIREALERYLEEQEGKP